MMQYNVTEDNNEEHNNNAEPEVANRANNTMARASQLAAATAPLQLKPSQQPVSPAER